MRNKLITTGQHKLIVRNIHTGKNEEFPFLAQNSRSFEVAQSKAQRREREILDHLEGLKGESLSDSEIWNEAFEGIEDRDAFQIHEDDNFKVVKKEPSKLDKIKAQLKDDGNPYSGMGRNQALNAMVDEMQDQEHSEKEADKRMQEHLKNHGDTLAKLHQLEANARWSVDAKNSYRNALKKAIAQLSDPEGDPAVARKLVKDVEAHVESQRQERLAFLERQEAFVAKQRERISMEKFVLLADEESQDEISRLDAEVKRLKAEEDRLAAENAQNLQDVAAIDEQLAKTQQ